ncbi:MAG: DUF120 domain-containing protein [Candidatus Bathyarchaeia archaeon]
MKPYLWFLLLRLGELGALSEAILTSTTTLAEDLGCSQQTVSRWLKCLSEGGYIDRRIDMRGEHVEITRKGAEELTKIYSALGALLRGRRRRVVSIEGKLFSGLGEGAYYVSKDGYMKQFTSKLGFKPYPGTLNLRLSRLADVTLKKELERSPGILVEGFSNDKRTYGSLKCFNAVVEGKCKGAVVLIERSHYGPDVVEVVAPVYLRDELKLFDGATVKVKVFL